MWSKSGANGHQSGATLIAANASIEGDLRFVDELVVNGEVHGNVYARDGATATISIGSGGTVHGEIHVPKVLVSGHVVGDIYASDHVELSSKAVVEGNVYYNLMEMVGGAQVKGELMPIEKAAVDGDADQQKVVPAEFNQQSAAKG